MRHLRHSVVAAWLGLLALVMQAALPVEVASALAGTGARHAPHLAPGKHRGHGAPAHAPAGPGDDHRHDHHRLCPACVGMHGGGLALLAPAPAVPPATVREASVIAWSAPDRPFSSSSPAAYSARAPPA